MKNLSKREITKMVDEKLIEFAMERVDNQDYKCKEKFIEDLEEEKWEIEACCPDDIEENRIWESGYLSGYEQALKDYLLIKQKW